MDIKVRIKIEYPRIGVPRCAATVFENGVVMYFFGNYAQIPTSTTADVQRLLWQRCAVRRGLGVSRFRRKSYFKVDYLTEFTLIQ